MTSFDSDNTVPKVSIETLEISRAEFIDAAGGDVAFREGLAAADFLIVPLPGHGDYVAPVFPQGTMEVLQFLHEKVPEGMRADIAINDEAYEELTLHAADIILPTFLTNPVLVGIAINLASSYLYDLLKDAKARRQTRVRARLIVEGNQRSVAIEYDGPAEQFAELTRSALARALPPAEPVRDEAAAHTDDTVRLLDAGKPRPLCQYA